MTNERAAVAMGRGMGAGRRTLAFCSGAAVLAGGALIYYLTRQWEGLLIHMRTHGLRDFGIRKRHAYCQNFGPCKSFAHAYWGSISTVSHCKKLMTSQRCKCKFSTSASSQQVQPCDVMDDEKEDLVDIVGCLDSVAKEARELYLPDHVPYLGGIPKPLDFYRNFVCPNRPVIIRNAINHWPALHKWNIPYLRSVYGENEVTVSVTPNGYADAVNNGYFVMPEERTMTFGAFLDIMEDVKNGTKDNESSGVFYVQKQNSNLTTEFSKLMQDVESDIPWATEAFGSPPDAVNFWMGQEKAVTSLHKDHYENLYCVLSGRKHFTLLPPTDLPHIPYGKYPAAKYKETSPGDFEICEDPDTGSVPWIPVDPKDPDLKKWPCYAKARPIKCTVNAGEMLYLPSLWFHHVQQDDATIAVNYWYDMEYGIKYNYFKFLESVAALRETSS